MITTIKKTITAIRSNDDNNLTRMTAIRQNDDNDLIPMTTILNDEGDTMRAVGKKLV